MFITWAIFFSYFHFYIITLSNDIAVDPVALSYRTNQRSTPEGAKVNVRYLLNLIMRFLPFGRNDTTMALGGISILLATIYQLTHDSFSSQTCHPDHTFM